MKFAVGYQLHEEEEHFIDTVQKFKDHIKEVHFPWSNVPICWAALTNRRGFVDWDGQKRLEADVTDKISSKLHNVIVEIPKSEPYWGVSPHFKAIGEHDEAIWQFDAVRSL